MTPEELGRIEKEINFYDTFNPNDFKEVVAEVRRLWAERDARLLVGRPVSEDLLTRAKRWRHDTSRDNEAAWPMTLSTVDLVDHIIFLERLLADADDLPQVRRTGYRDGWRAAMSKAKAMAREVAWPEDVKAMERYLEELAERGPE